MKRRCLFCSETSLCSFWFLHFWRLRLGLTLSSARWCTILRITSAIRNLCFRNRVVFGAALISNLFIPFFSEKRRKQVMIITAALSLISYASVYIVFFAAAYFLLAFRFGIFTTPLNTLAWGMVADCVDYAEWKTGVRADGVVISSMSFINKLGVALAGSFSFISESPDMPRIPIRLVIECD